MKVLPGPKSGLWSATQFYRLLDEGFFLEQRVELLEGKIIQMPSESNLHAVGIALGAEALRKRVRRSVLGAYANVA